MSVLKDTARNAAILAVLHSLQFMQNLVEVPVLSWPFAICFTRPLNQQEKNV